MVGFALALKGCTHPTGLLIVARLIMNIVGAFGRMPVSQLALFATPFVVSLSNQERPFDRLRPNGAYPFPE